MKKFNSPDEMGYGFHSFFNPDGKFYFQFNEAFGTPILFSQGYKSEKSRDNGIQSIIRNASMKKQYEFKKNKKGKLFFILKAKNGQEIGRSKLFGTRQEMEEKLTIISQIKSTVPVFKSVEQHSNNKPITSSAIEDTIPVLSEKMVKVSSPENLPRYKFSLVYYPDSQIWQIKHDQSEDSKEFKIYDGALIESFVKKHLPAEIMEKEKEQLATSNKKALDTQPSINKSLNATPRKEELLDMELYTFHKERIRNTVKANQLGRIEIPLDKLEKGAVYDCKVFAKSMAGMESTVIGELKKQMPFGRGLTISINQASKLKPGWYRLSTTLDESLNGLTKTIQTESQLVLLN